MRIKPHYEAIDRMIALIRERFQSEDPYIAEVFASCMENTLQKTIHFDGEERIFVATGDIPAMWLRDSTSQLMPFLRFASEEEDIREILLKLNMRQMQLILLDPYANAFNMGSEGSPWQIDRTDMRPELWERKYEIDSLCYPLQLSYHMWKRAGLTEQFDENWIKAVKLILKVFRTEQDHEGSSPYRFQRRDCVFTDTLSRDGKGALVRSGTG
ncbi:MAG: glycoside hydrolase family 125 protein, partial [Clostridia bacterium]|nr:glycoside hydrolase family 125 protein [Clostridia bacterium]